MLRTIRKITLATIFTVSGLAATNTATACDGASNYRPAPSTYQARYEPVSYSYKKITTWEVQRVAHKQPVIAYDQWGEPFIAHKTVYKNVKVPVTKLVKVWH